MTARVLVLGAGFGGLEVAAGLSERLGERVEVTLIDQNDHFVFGFAKLDVMFGHRAAASVQHPYRAIDKPGVRFVRTAIRAIDPQERRVETDNGSFEADHLVIALGADLDLGATPGLSEGGHEYYSTQGAFAARSVLESFTGGRIVIGVVGPVFKCPPAPSETALLAHDYLVRRGLREASEVALVMPLPAPVPPVPDASAGLLDAFAERGIQWHPGRSIASLDPGRNEIAFADGSTMDYDLFLGVPKHVVPAVVADAGLAPDGWVSVDTADYRTGFPGVYAIGDVAATGTPKAGVFAAGQARVVTSVVAAELGAGTPTVDYDGSGVCYVEFGGPRAAKVDVTFAAGAPPRGTFDAASEAISHEKQQYRDAMARRWIGEETAAPATGDSPTTGDTSDAT